VRDTIGRGIIIFKNLKDRLFLSFIRWLVASAISILVLQLSLDFLESYLYDLRIRIRPAPIVSVVIETIFIDPPTVQAVLGQPTLQDHIRFLEKLKLELPRAVVYLVNPNEINGTEAEKKVFTDLALSLPGFYVVVDDTAMRGEVGKFDLPGAMKNLKVLSGPLTSDSKIQAQDDVTRRMMLTYQGNILFHTYIASQLIPERAIPENIKGYFNFYDSEQAYIDFAPAGAFPKSSFIEVMNGKFASGRFHNKILFVGSDLLGKITGEYIKTPYSREVTAMTVVEAHANILNSIIQNSGVQTIPNWFNFLILLGLVILTVEVVLAMKPVKGLMVLGFTLVVFLIGSFIAFWPFGYWVKIAHPLIGVFTAYYFLIPYRLIIENRRSWELYQRNKLLTQVEELKNNFIGMMSHDLKTPLARIQGMIEIVFRDKNPLSEDQKKAISSIHQSTEDLLNFISSILNFSRLESQGVQLNLKSKDINSLIEDVILKTEYLAREKQIKIKKEFEPLFSIKIDPDLMRQVIANLIENAIKYSPNGSQVTIRTEEKENKIHVVVSDHGIGIPEDELPRLFMKFFRSRKAKNSSVKGSGLGLYLARYFVELHKGRLLVTSIENKGSTFTILLPIAE
jgi:signal transduction histidine kinase